MNDSSVMTDNKPGASGVGEDVHSHGDKSRFIDRMRDIVWPVYSHEVSRFLHITALMFCILFIQNLVRATKDSVITTMIGAEALPFLKTYFVMPGSILFSIMYVKLLNTLRGDKMFYAIIAGFIAFFTLFCFVIFPYFEELRLLSPETESALIKSYPKLRWFILICSNWGLSLFYVVAELWPSAAFGLLFWQFINSITNVDESRRFYPLFGLFGQTGLILSGWLLQKQEPMAAFLSQLIGMDLDVASVFVVMCFVIFFGLMSLYFFYRINAYVLPKDKGGYAEIHFRAKRKKMGIVESFAMAFRSKYIMLIAVMLVCYGAAINLVEGPWKAEATKHFTNNGKYLAFEGMYLTWTGIGTVALVMVASNVVRKVGWYVAALVTPVTLFISGFLFFIVATHDNVDIFNTSGDSVSAIIGWLCMRTATDPLILAVMIGAVQNALTKSCKYTLFDSTKEMAYVPLDDELKTRGKAAVDVIGTKIGKSGSAFIQSLILSTFPNATYHSITNYLMVVFVIVCILWLYAVRALSRLYTQYASTAEEHDKEEETNHS